MKDLVRTKPWNRVDQPVYSIASFADGRHNMNICTYAFPVALKPKQYIVAIYKNTLTEKLVKQQHEFVLQFLSGKHEKLIQLLGRTSGFQVDKLKHLPETLPYKQFQLLPDLVAYVHLNVITWIDSADHSCALCEVVFSKNVSNRKILSTSTLRTKKIIRA
ncbi:hypothetical protein BH09BAC3_BH09BAC3_09820 [soil metagenome]